MELKDIKVSISLEELLNLNYYRRKEYKLTVSQKWIMENNLTEESFPGLTSLLHFREILNGGPSAIATMVEISLASDWKRTHEAKDIQSKIKEVKVEEAKSKFSITEDWKKSALRKLLLTGKINSVEANKLIVRAMNPAGELDRKIAEKLDYPFRDEIVAEETNNQTA